ncbi:MAG: LacI family DNA-binding transcriptional regulator [Actinomycetales bacterium]
MTRPNTYPGRVTLKQVAGQAGVSLSTASLVFSGNGPVSEGTRTRVLAAAQALNYAGPNPVAANLRRGRCGVVGVVVEGSLRHALQDPYALAVVNGLAEVLDSLPVGMLMLSLRPQAPQELRDRLRMQAMDGVVFFGCGPDAVPAAEHLRDRNISMVAMGQPYLDGVRHVDIDERIGMLDLARQLSDLGHRRVLAVAQRLAPADAPQGSTGAAVPIVDALARAEFPDVLGRLAAIREVFGDSVPTVNAGASTIDAGFAAVTEFLHASGSDRPTAIMTTSDQLAFGAIQAVRAAGLDVPADVSVTGFDGIDPPNWAGNLTTVHQPGSDKGRAAARLVHSMIEGDPGADLLLPTTVRLGDSTGPPPW